MDDKTVRGDGNFVSSDMNQDATYRADSGIISSGMNTPAVNSAVNDSTVRTDGDFISSGGGDIIGSGFSQQEDKNSDEFELNGKKYKLIKIISQSTGEAEIFLVEGEIEGEHRKAIFKLYKGNYRVKEDVINQIKSLNHEDIIKVYDYGFYKDKFTERFFELMEFAEGGSVLEHSPIKSLKKIKDIVNETINAINFLHSKDIIHRDIKPGNLFYRDSEKTDIVLADFGIASKKDARVSRHITKIAGSDLYLPPEGLRFANIRDRDITKVAFGFDYYSLGVSLMVIWLGEKKFDEYLDNLPGGSSAWNELKEKNKFDLPTDMPEEVQTLIRGLTLVDTDNRWGFNECTRWLKGEKVPVIKDKLITIGDYKPFAFDEDAVATNPEELAAFMQKDMALAEKYLYRGKIKDWIEEAKNMKLAMLLEDICDTQFKKNKSAGVFAAIYLLNNNLPYVDSDGNKCETLLELSDLIENNIDNYAQKLQKRDDGLYIYLDSKGLGDLSDSLFNYFKDYDEDLAIMYVIYALNPDKPFRFTHPKDKSGNKETLVYREKISDFANLFNNYKKESIQIIENGSLEAWLSFDEEQYYFDMIKYLREEVGKKNKDSMVVGAVFAFDSTMCYTATDGSICETKTEVADALLKNFDAYTKLLKNDYTFLHMYAIVKEWDKELNLMRHSFNMKNHKNKLFPYNEKIALMKVIRSLNKTSPIEISNKLFKTPQELLNADQSVKNIVKDELKNLDSKIHAWLSVYFHEDPYLTFKKKGDYEDKLKEYMDFIEQLSPNNDLSKRYLKAKDSLPKQIQKEKNADARFVFGNFVAIVIAVLSGVLLFKYVLISGGNEFLPGAFWDLPSTYYLVLAILGIILTFAGGDASLSTGCIGGPIVGAIAGIILYYVFYFMVSSVYITGGLILALLGYLIYDLYENGSTYTSKAIRAQIFDMNDKLTFEWEPLAFAFSNKDKFDSKRASLLDDYHAHRKQNKKYILKRTVVPIAIFIAVLLLLLSYDPAYDQDFAAVKEFIVSVYDKIVGLF